MENIRDKEAEALRKAAQSGFGGTYDQLVNSDNDISNTMNTYLEPPKETYTSRMTESTLTPLRTQGEETKARAKERYDAGTERATDLQALIETYRDDALEGQQGTRDAKTQAETRRAFNAERDYATKKQGQEKLMMGNLASMGAIGTTAAPDIGSMGIDAAYQGNLDKVEKEKLDTYASVNDMYVKEVARIKDQHMGNQAMIDAELNKLDAEYDEALDDVDYRIAMKESEIRGIGTERDIASEEDAAQRVVDAFLQQVEAGSYDGMSEQDLNAKARQVGGKNWEALAFQARQINDMRNSEMARYGKVDEVLSDLMSAGFSVNQAGRDIIEGMLMGDVPLSTAQAVNRMVDSKGSYLTRITPLKVKGTGSGTTKAYEYKEIGTDEAGNAIFSDPRSAVRFWVDSEGNKQNPIGTVVKVSTAKTEDTGTKYNYRNVSTGEMGQETVYITQEGSPLPIGEIIDGKSVLYSTETPATPVVKNTGPMLMDIARQYVSEGREIDAEDRAALTPVQLDYLQSQINLIEANS